MSKRSVIKPDLNDPEVVKERESLPMEDRTQEYYDIWDMIFDEVVSYWDPIEQDSKK